MMDAIMVAIATGIISSVSTVAALRTEISWIKRELERLNSRVYELESK